MQIKNYHKEKLNERFGCHDGEGMFLNNGLFTGDDFKSNIQFMNYTILPKGSTIGNHEHTNDEEIYIILSGTGEMYFDGVSFPVTAGSVTVNKPYGTHGLKNTGDTDMALLVFEVKID